MEFGLDESCVQYKCYALAYMALAVGGIYWRRGGVNQWDLPRADLGFCNPFRGLTRKLFDLGFEHRALEHMSLVVGGTHRRRGDMLLHICHSPWVTHIGVMMVICSCMYVTHRGRCHTLISSADNFLSTCGPLLTKLRCLTLIAA